jgi:hypothetical protein
MTSSVVGPLVLVIGLAWVVSTVLEGPNPSKQPFAGYTWQGNVTSVAGSWTVPAILGGGSLEVAGTWIGAQTTGSTGPFIQIGTTEQRLSSSLYSLSVPSTYFAFWSDATRDFHPVRLFGVNPGDAVSATMALAQGRWTITVVDSTSDQEARVTTKQEADSSFNLAEWTQEDVTNGLTGKPYPYPPLSGIAFHGLEVNAATPDGADMFPESMAQNGYTLAPGPYADGAFALRQVTVRPAGPDS